MRHRQTSRMSANFTTFAGFLGVVVLGSGIWLSTGTPVLAQSRTAKVAGQFYPDDRAELLDLVSELLKRQPAPANSSKPRILIVPHAGYQYSGLIAANGFRQLQGETYDGVVVVGFLHRSEFAGASVDTREAYETPLGEIPVHQEAVAILQTYPGIEHVEEAHESGEHSLEVELPFLQAALERFRLVPVLIGNTRLEDADRLATALAGLSRLGDYLFVFSTDLSHYHPYSEAERIDEGTISAILAETPQAVSHLFSRGQIEACGRAPIITSLLLSAKLGYLTRQLLYHANSGDTAGDPSRVVGYATIAMFDRLPQRRQQLSAGAGAALVRAAREILEQHLAKKADAAPEVTMEYHPELLSRGRGLFVTLRKRGALRGCIGRIESSEPLSKMVPVLALDAALHDARFTPVNPDELPEIQVEVSVLTPPVRIKDPHEIVAGRDGVVLAYEGHSGVFLPQVWDETGWTRIEFLRELASQKAGLPPDAWQRATLSTFQAQIFEEEPLPLERTAQ